MTHGPLETFGAREWFEKAHKPVVRAAMDLASTGGVDEKRAAGEVLLTLLEGGWIQPRPDGLREALLRLAGSLDAAAVLTRAGDAGSPQAAAHLSRRLGHEAESLRLAAEQL